jgi:hypothetical protein
MPAVLFNTHVGLSPDSNLKKQFGKSNAAAIVSRRDPYRSRVTTFTACFSARSDVKTSGNPIF